MHEHTDIRKRIEGLLTSGRPGLPVAAALAILAVAPVIALSAAWFYTHYSGAADAGVMKPGLIEHRQTVQTVIYFAALHCAVLGLGLAALALVPGERVALSPSPGGMRDYVVATVALVTGGGLWLWALWLLAPDAVAAEVGDYPRLVRTGWGILLAPVLCLVAPAAEEVLFRGLLFRALAATPLRAPGAALLSSFTWAALHVDHSWLSRTHLFAAGLLLCWIVHRTGTLRVAIWCHVLFNLLLTLLLIATVTV